MSHPTTGGHTRGCAPPSDLRPEGSGVRAGPRGFTLIEVIGALVILSIGILLAGSFSSGLTELMRDATLRTEAMNLGRQTVDSIAQLSYSDLTAGTTHSDVVEVEVETDMTINLQRSWVVVQHNVRTLRVSVLVAPQGVDTMDCPLPTGRHRWFCSEAYVVESW